MLMFLMTEFLVILLFLLVFVSFKTTVTADRSHRAVFYIFMTTALIIFVSTIPLMSSQLFTVYDYVYIYALDVIGHDLFIFFFYLFVEVPTTICFLATILGLMSIFFIAVYFTLKHAQQKHFLKKKALSVLRKQHLNRQAVVKPSLQMFQRVVSKRIF